MIILWIVEDHFGFRNDLVQILEGYPDLYCAKSFENGSAFLRELNQSKAPDVVLMDYRMPGISGAEAVKELRQRFPNQKVVFLTAHSDKETVLECIQAGANGYLVKGTSPRELYSAVRASLLNEMPLDSKVTQYLVDRAPLDKVITDEILSSNELAILRGLARGMVKKEVADALNLNVHTLDSQMMNLFRKLECHNQSEAVAKGFAFGFLTVKDINI